MTEEKEEFKKRRWTPVLRERSSLFFVDLLKKEQPDKVLEIGTCVGNSGLSILENCPNAFLKTVEIEKEKCEIAKHNFETNGFSERVEVICDDAMNVIKRLEKEGAKFNFIFLDGAKGQYVKYLPIIKNLLEKNGVLFADNIFFHGMVQAGYPKHKHRTIVFRLRDFINKIKNDIDFETQIYDIEDGISISRLKNHLKN